MSSGSRIRSYPISISWVITRKRSCIGSMIKSIRLIRSLQAWIWTWRGPSSRRRNWCAIFFTSNLFTGMPFSRISNAIASPLLKSKRNRSTINGKNRMQIWFLTIISSTQEVEVMIWLKATISYLSKRETGSSKSWKSPRRKGSITANAKSSRKALSRIWLMETWCCWNRELHKWARSDLMCFYYSSQSGTRSICWSGEKSQRTLLKSMKIKARIMEIRARVTKSAWFPPNWRWFRSVTMTQSTSFVSWLTTHFWIFWKMKVLRKLISNSYSINFQLWLRMNISSISWCTRWTWNSETGNWW